MAELIDTHCHLTFDDLYGQIDAVISRSIEAGVTGWVTIGTEPEHVRKVVELPEKYENLRAGVGIHPHYAENADKEDIKLIEKSAEMPGVVAIGETGLDYYYGHSGKEAQKSLFRTLLAIAAEKKLPAIIHTRDAFDDTLEILEEYQGRLTDAVVHCFSGTADQARILIERGYYISFTGIVTFKKTESVREAARAVPLEKMMVETDCPFISPEPLRNQKPCEPAMMVHTAGKLAEVKGLDYEEFARAVTANSVKFFRL